MLSKIKTHKRGSALYLSIVIMVALLAIALGLSAILWGQLRMMGRVGSSVIAFYAADTGIEHSLFDLSQSGSGAFPGSIGQDSYEAEYEVFYEDEGCGIEKWTSIGTYRGTKRAILSPRTDFYFAMAVSDVCAISGVESVFSLNDNIAAAFFTSSTCDVNFSVSSTGGIQVDNINHCPATEFNPLCLRDLDITVADTVSNGSYEIEIEAQVTSVIKQVIMNVTVADVCP